mmetsp:Transcript_28705/g.25776  ORF Transcript_28705/g.25776 Transcript_28705/m.25776 type:complete len:104 (+) Transcript_28705:2531-2842(+)
MMRVFEDRLINDDDRNWFNDQIESSIKEHLELEWTADDFVNIIFGDFTNSAKEYEKIENRDELSSKFTDYLMIYNNSPGSKPMNLVFFKNAIDHLSRIIRVLR